ncbi:head-tail adaptor protein [Psychrosphaera sp. 1_MG-2023]|uniref:head-tail adaptor protein n=1 Tax=Psychrosphaera sp. 1_MG-2023 TaxID=3062643 RepID=UPI0034A2BA85
MIDQLKEKLELLQYKTYESSLGDSLDLLPVGNTRAKVKIIQSEHEESGGTELKNVVIEITCRFNTKLRQISHVRWCSQIYNLGPVPSPGFRKRYVTFRAKLHEV